MGALKIDVGRKAFCEEASAFRVVTPNELGNGVSFSDCYVAVWFTTTLRRTPADITHKHGVSRGCNVL